MATTDTSTVTVVLSGSEEAITFTSVRAWEEGRKLVLARGDEVVARFELYDLKHWYTDPS
jgi:hypothetical protein